MTDSNQRSFYQTRHFKILCALLCIGWLYVLGLRTLVPTDEGRYAEMAREMLASGDWITTRLNGIKYFEKPPLQIWMTALAFKFFGLGEWQARLWGGLCGLLGIGLVAYTGQRLYRTSVGISAALVLASSLLWNGMAHMNTLDMSLAAMMTLALCSLLLAQNTTRQATERATEQTTDPTSARRWMCCCWAGMALAVLSKGLVGIVLPGATLVLYSLLCRDFTLWKRLHLGTGLLVFFAISAPWFVLVSLQHPEFPQFFFIHEHFQRFTTTIHRRTAPWHYFIPILLIGILPWLGMLFQSLWQALHTSLRAPNTATQKFQSEKLLLIWVSVIFVFFSLSHSKLASYILPIFPALALLIALHLEHASRLAWKITAGLLIALGTAGALLAPRIPHWASQPIEATNYHSAIPWVMAASVLLLLAGGLVAWQIKQKKPALALTATGTIAIASVIAGSLLQLSTEAQGRYRSGYALVAAIQAESTSDTPFYAVEMYDQTLPFYLGRTMTLVNFTDELAFGLQQEPQRALPTRAAFIEQWKNNVKALAIMQHSTYASLQQQGVPMRIVAQDTRRIIVTNHLVTNHIVANQ